MSKIATNRFVLTLLKLLITLTSSAQKNDTLSNGVMLTANDSIFFSQSMPVLTPDACLLPILEEIMTVDSAASYFGEGRDQIGYSIEFRDHEGYISMDIWPLHFSKSLQFDYFGVINMGSTSFLCRGNYRTDKILTNSGNKKIMIVLKRPVIRADHDAFDRAIFDLSNNVSLYGTYIECESPKILLSVYIEGRITRFGKR